MIHRSIQFRSFRVDFVTMGDRIAHAIYVADSQDNSSQRRWVELLRSVESPADAAWPESPPLQELHIEDRNGQSVALLVGRAGKSHWSASIGCARQANGAADSAEQLVFDIACRVTSMPALLASSYGLAEGVAWLGQERPMTADPARWQSISLLTPAEMAWRVSVDTPGTILAPPTSRELRVTPPAADIAPTTLRWRFCIAAASQAVPASSGH